MRKWIFGGLAAAFAAVGASAQQPARVTSGYLVIRVVLEGGDGGGFAAAPGGGDPRGGGGLNPRGGPGGGVPAGPGGGIPGGPGGRGGGVPAGPGGGVPAGPGGRGGDIGSPDGGDGGMAGGFGGFGGGVAASVSTDPSKSVVVVVPFFNLKREMLYPPPGGRGNRMMDSIQHKYGKTFIFADNSSIQIFPIQRVTLENEVRLRHNAWIKNRVLSDGYRLCRDALTHGMLKEAFEYSRELANQVEIKKDVKPPQDVAEFVAAFKTFESTIDNPPAKAGNASDWQKRVNGEAVTDSTHYSIIHPRDIPPEEINRRLETLEKNFKAFYLWHAMSRKALPLPQSRLVVILPKTASDVERMRNGLDGSDVISDATFAKLHNVVVMSPERLDLNSRAFQNLVAPLWRDGYAREELIRGIAPKNVATKTAEDHARAMMLALVDKALEDEADFAALTREGSRQLYIASGQLPQNVNLPEWVENGSASLFQKPKGPLFLKEGNRNIMTVSMSAGYGSPNFHYRRYFQMMDRSGKLNPNRSDLLVNTISDLYFEAARKGIDIDPAAVRVVTQGGGAGAPPPGQIGGPGGPRGGPGGPRGGPGGPGGAPPRGQIGGPPGGGEISEGNSGGGPPQPEVDPEEQKIKSKQELMIKAQTTAWALTYYLSREKLAGLQDFYAQLSRMPRDLHLDDKTVLLTFCRSFNLMRGDEIDREELDRFAQGWVDYMKNAPFFHFDIPLGDSQQNPGGPGGPGGLNPRGGPGGPGGAPGGGGNTG
jgi:hypothetical protein